jgi:very-short-patch-repair endonuclease
MKKIIRKILREHTKHINEGKRLTTPEFKERAKKVHGDKYEYTKVDYKNNKTPVIITCPEHGDFFQLPGDHLRGSGCRGCAGTLPLNTEEFIKKAKKIHGEKYKYDKVDYKNNWTPVTITCPEHGDFSQIPSSHLSGHGCNKCAMEQRHDSLRSNTEEFIEKAKKIHGEKYGYTKVDYKNNWTPVTITCPKHGDFSQVPSYHLSGSGCQRCYESKGEKFVSKILDNLGIEYKRGYEFMDCVGICKKLPFDFYIPEMNTCIEYDGKQHFEPIYGEDNLKAIQSSDRKKDIYCESKGIKLIRIKYTMKWKDIEPYIIRELNS